MQNQNREKIPQHIKDIVREINACEKALDETSGNPNLWKLNQRLHASIPPEYTLKLRTDKVCLYGICKIEYR